MSRLKCIYIDWNIFQDLIQARKSPRLAENLDAGKAKGYALPYSHAHLSDLLRCSSLEWVKKDLDQVTAITDSWCVGPRKDGSGFGLDRIRPHLVYEAMAWEPQQAVPNSSNFQFPPYTVDVSKLSADNVIRPYLQQSNNLMSPAVLQRLINDILERGLDDHKLQKNFRESFTEVVRLNQPNNKEIAAWPIYQYLLASAEEIEDNFMTIFRSFLSIDGKALETISEEDKIRTAYGVLDFFPVFKEKIERKNNLNNMITDGLHAYIAAQCAYYICGDRKSVIKAKIVYRAFGIPTKVYYVDDFIRNVEL